jgi:hypothetical protein
LSFALAEQQNGERWYSAHLYSSSPKSALKVPVVPPRFSDDSPLKDGYEVLNACFDAGFEQYPELFAFGEDVGRIGDDQLQDWAQRMGMDLDQARRALSSSLST